MWSFIKSKRTVYVLVAVALGVAVYLWAPWGRQAKASDYVTAEVEQGSIRNVVNATGIVQTVVTVQVGSQVSGQVLQLYADFNSLVKQGQLLAKVDPRSFEAQLENSKASVTAAAARVRNAEADIRQTAANAESSKASLELARVSRDNAKVILDRSLELDRKGLISRNDLDTTKANWDSANARYAQAVAELNRIQDAQDASARASLDQAKAQLEQAQADLERANLNLEYTNIYSPVDGVVISRSIDVGQTIAASLQSPTLFTIANDLGRMQVNANVDEADIGNISSSDGVRFTVDAYPGDTFNAKISEIRLSPQTVQNVVTYSVILGIDNRAMKLRPGMTALITFIVDERNDVVKIPNAATRFTPEGQSSGRGGRGGRRGAEGRGGNNGEARGDVASEPAADAKGDGSTEKRGEASSSVEGRGNRGAEGRGGRGEARGGGGRRGGQAEGGTDGSPGEKGQTRGQTQAAPRGDTGAPLAPGQMWNIGDKMRFQAAKRRTERSGTVWVLNAELKPEMRQLTLGISDGSFSEMLSGDLKAGDAVIVGDTATASRSNQNNATRNPLLQGIGGGGGGGGRRGGGF